MKPSAPRDGSPAAPHGWRSRLRALKRESLVVYYVARDPRLPWHVRLLALAVAAYALSPIDLIPDFIPVLGYLDDLLIVPAGIWLVVRCVPPALMAEFREQADSRARPRSRVAAAIIIALWLALAGLLLWLWLR